MALIRPLAGLALLGLLGGLLVSPAYAAVNGTGVLYIYSDAAGTTLLPQNGGIMGYILPATGTTVYIQIKGITEPAALTSGTLASGTTSIFLRYNGSGVEQIKTISGVTVTSGNTALAPWVVGDFSDTSSTLVQIAPCKTGPVRYGTAPNDNYQYKTKSNGGVNDGKFIGPGSTYVGTTCFPPRPVPEFGGPFAEMLVGMLGLAGVYLARKRLPGLTRRI